MRSIRNWYNKWLSFRKSISNGDSGNKESEEEMFGVTDLEITPAGSAEKRVIYAIGVLNYMIESIYKIF